MWSQPDGSKAVVLDPCSTEAANERVQAQTYFDAAKDGLKTAWPPNPTRTWLHAPHDDAAQAAFIDRVLKSGTEALIYAPLRPGREWAKMFSPRRTSSACRPRGR